MRKSFDTSLAGLISKPSSDFLDFIEQYLSLSMTNARGEWDETLPLKLKGDELDVAIKLIEKNLSTSSLSILAAIRILNLRELIPKIMSETIRVSLRPNLSEEDMYFDMTLAEWVPFPQFFDFCYSLMTSKGHSHQKECILQNCHKFKGVDVSKLYSLGLRDPQVSVRFVSFESLLKYLSRTQDAKLKANDFLSKEIYVDKLEFENRLLKLAQLLGRETL